MIGIWLRFVMGVRVGAESIFKGWPLVRIGGKGSSISIGNRFLAISRLSDNAIGVPHRVIIRTVASGARIVIGDDVGVSGCVIVATKSIKIGHRVLVGSGALIVDSDLHPQDKMLRQREPWNKGACAPIVIGDDVFIGTRAIILKGVTIGPGAIVGAGAVVTQDVPAGAVVAGNPARVVRESV